MAVNNDPERAVAVLDHVVAQIEAIAVTDDPAFNYQSTLAELTGTDREFVVVPVDGPFPVTDRTAAIGAQSEDEVSFAIGVTYAETPDLVRRVLTDATRIADTLRALVVSGRDVGIVGVEQTGGGLDVDGGLVVMTRTVDIRYRRKVTVT